MKLLDKSNCRGCEEATCLAFAAAVFKGENRLSECTRLDKDVIERFERKSEKRRSIDQDRVEAFERLKKQIAKTDLASAAARVGGRFSDNKLTLKILGKEFSLDSKGNLSSDIHVNPWVAIPVLIYVLHSAGRTPTGEWMPFRELKGGKEWAGRFGQRCEKPLKRVALVMMFEKIAFRHGAR